MMTRRHPYADRLLEYADFAFGEERVFDQRGQWRDYFAQRIGTAFNGRIVFEVGCFDAALLCRVAAKQPGTAFVGLDWKFKSLFLGAERIAEAKLRNVALLRGRAQEVSNIFADREVDEIWVFHPDPCDRAVELKHRLIAEPFLTNVHRVLREETSSLCLKTDHPGYYQWVLGLFGLPEPAWFQPAREAKFHPSTAAYEGPRVKAKEVVDARAIPAKSEATIQRFSVSQNTPDYWNDPAALAHTAYRGFANETTFFESRFLKKRLPIYYFEITRAKRPST